MGVRIDSLTCNGCLVCVDLCPTSALKVTGGICEVLDILCVDCDACILRCPMESITKI